MRILTFILLFSLSAGCTSNLPSTATPLSYRFVVANAQLFAIANRHAYGTEQGVLVSADLGGSWLPFSAPDKTRNLCGDGNTLFALTSKGEVWRKPASGSDWTRFWSSHGSYRRTYDIDIGPAGQLFITACDAIVVVNDQGKVTHEYSTSGDEFFVRSSIVGDQHLIIECNPFAIAVLDTEQHRVIPWNDGFSTLLDDGLTGPCRVRRHGTRFLASRADGVYVADRILQPWNMLTDEFRLEGLNSEFCRDLASLDADHDRWLIATDSGIHIMNGSVRGRTVFEDTDDDHNLILTMTEFKNSFFISFARLRNAMGVRLPKDLSQWQTTRGRPANGIP